MSNLADIKARAQAVKSMHTPFGAPGGGVGGYIPVSEAEKALAQLIIDLAEALEPLVAQ